MKKVKLKKNIEAVIIITVAIIVVILCIIKVTKPKTARYIVYKDNLDSVVMTIDGTEVTLSDIAYYVTLAEDRMQAMAKAYNPNNPKEFWKKHYSAASNSKFNFEIAKDEAYNLCVYDYVMEMEAKKQGFSLAEAKQAEADKKAEVFYKQMSDKSRENVGLTEEKLKASFERHEISKAYVVYLSELKGNFDKNYDSTLLNYDGKTYLTEILPKHKVSVNNDVWDKIILGEITVNNQ